MLGRLLEFSLKIFDSGTGPTSTSPVDTQSQLSNPVDIGNHQTLAVPPGPLVVFNGLLPLDGSIKGGFTAYNGGVSNDQIAQFASDAAQIASQVGKKLQDESVNTDNLDLETGADILNAAGQFFHVLLNSNNNNITVLGTQPIEINANFTSSFSSSNSLGSYLAHSPSKSMLTASRPIANP